MTEYRVQLPSELFGLKAQKLIAQGKVNEVSRHPG